MARSEASEMDKKRKQSRQIAMAQYNLYNFRTHTHKYPDNFLGHGYIYFTIHTEE